MPPQPCAGSKLEARVATTLGDPFVSFSLEASQQALSGAHCRTKPNIWKAEPPKPGTSHVPVTEAFSSPAFCLRHLGLDVLVWVVGVDVHL